MQKLVIAALMCASLMNVLTLEAQQTLSVGINTDCKAGQVSVLASTYHADPFCSHWSTAPAGGCTQWKLFRDGQLTSSKYTVPASGSIQFPNTTPLDYYNLGRFPVSQPGQYQIKMSYSRIVCTGWWIFRRCDTHVYVNETPVISVSQSDLNPATWSTKCPLGSFDGANCFVMVKPAGGFIWGRGFYMPATKGTNCPLGSYDGANCFVMVKPANGFIWNNGFYVPAGSGGSCSIGTFDGANCFIAKAPWGTSAFQWGGNFYVTPLPSCPQGSFDGANCLLATAPFGTNMFEWGGNFYVTPRQPCQ